MEWKKKKERERKRERARRRRSRKKTIDKVFVSFSSQSDVLPLIAIPAKSFLLLVDSVFSTYYYTYINLYECKFVCIVCSTFNTLSYLKILFESLQESYNMATNEWGKTEHKCHYILNLFYSLGHSLKRFFCT